MDIYNFGEFHSKKFIDECRSRYNNMLKSGYFWVIYPELSGKWEEDKDKWIESQENIINKNEHK